MTEAELVTMINDYCSAIKEFGTNYFLAGACLGLLLGIVLLRVFDLVDYLSKNLEEKKKAKKEKEKTDEK